MMGLKFSGLIPVWAGLLLGFVMAVLSWLYYSRERFNLPRRLKFVLPLLRATAFFLGIFILTGPILHRQQRVGQLGKVSIFIDASKSMSQRDPQMSLYRKLEISQKLGWLNAEKSLPQGIESLDRISESRRRVENAISSVDEDSPLSVRSQVTEWISSLESSRDIPENRRVEMESEILIPARQLGMSREKPGLESTDLQRSGIRKLRDLTERGRKWEAVTREQLNRDFQQAIGTEQSGVTNAIDLFDNSTRFDRLKLALSRPLPGSTRDILAELKTKHDVELFLMSESTRSIPLGSEAEPVTRVEDWAEQTDLVSGVRYGIRPPTVPASSAATVEDASQTAVVLVTDGQHNAGGSPVELARQLGQQGYRFYNVAIGADRPAFDASVLSINSPHRVYAQDIIQGELVVRESLAPELRYTVQIKHLDDVVWEKQLVSNQRGERQINFQFPVEEWITKTQANSAGFKQQIQQLELVASIVPIRGEKDTSNNKQSFRVNIVTEKQKLLILDGRSRWETRFIRNAFERDPQWQVRTVIAGQSVGLMELPRGDQPGQFPRTKAELTEYDLIIWGEIDPTLFTNREYQWLVDLIGNQGCGIIFIDGSRGRLRELEQTAIGVLLPIQNAKPGPERPVTSLQLTSNGMETAALSLMSDPQTNREFWQQLPVPQNINSVEPTADATTLLEFSNEQGNSPAMVRKAFGAGKVLYLAFDETWRWRYKSADLWHQRIWHQLAKLTIPAPFATSDDYVSLDTGAASYQVGEKPAVRVRLMGLDGQPNSDAVVDIVVQQDGIPVANVSLQSEANVPGEYRGEIEPLPAGDYEVSVQASGYPINTLKAKNQFRVLPPVGREMTATEINANLLKQMANESGGEYLVEEQLRDLPQLLESFSNGQMVETEIALGQSLWWFGAILAILTLEWVLRKRGGLL